LDKWKKAVVNDQDPTSPRPSGARRLLSHPGRWIAVGAVACAAIGIPVGIAASSDATSPSATAGHSAPASGHAGSGGPGGGSNARSGPAEGGSAGTIDAVSASTFTLTTSTGQQVTVTETSATTYQNGTGSISASALSAGEPVLVLGRVDGTTITAVQVIEQSTSAGSAAPAVPFQQGAPSTAKQVGQIPADYTEGSGTIVSGTTADKATAAALGAYTGGVVDRVVQLSSGEYEVHNIGVNWPHHIFVDQDFQVVGAE
jgi:membrane-bound inhibitor of C-type lysozyme